jgi:hypothetical protein
MVSRPVQEDHQAAHRASCLVAILVCRRAPRLVSSGIGSLEEGGVAAKDRARLAGVASVRRRAGRYQSPGYRAKRLLLGRPLQTAQLVNQRITKTVALAVFSSTRSPRPPTAPSSS